MTRTYQQLSAEERGVAMGMKLQACSMRAIARAPHRSPSTISRELRRNGWQSQAEHCIMGRTRIAGGYNTHRAGQRARRVRRAAWPTRKLHPDGALWAEVRALLALKLAPEQIAAKLRLRHPGQPQLQASHETIYSANVPPSGERRCPCAWKPAKNPSVFNQMTNILIDPVILAVAHCSALTC